jgi:hypothetical protein
MNKVNKIKRQRQEAVAVDSTGRQVANTNTNVWISQKITVITFLLARNPNDSGIPGDPGCLQLSAGTHLLLVSWHLLLIGVLQT